MEEEMSKRDKLIERLWNDIAGLPWKDKAWANNPQMVSDTKLHYVTATQADWKELTSNEALQIVIDMLDAQMEETPSRELADVSNYLQELLNKEKTDADTTSKND
jgi:hypothetical protein